MSNRAIMAGLLAALTLASPVLAVEIEVDASALQPGEAKWVVGEAEVYLEGKTPESAREECIMRARADAIQKAVGLRAWSTTIDFATEADTEVFEHYWRMASVDMYGHIVEEDDPVWGTRVFNDVIPVFTCSLRARVERVADPDPGFWVNVKLNRSPANYREGEEVILTVEAGKDCYLHVLNIYSDGVVRVLSPSELLPAIRLKEGDLVEVPSEEQRRRGIHLRPQLLEGRDVGVEQVIVVATLDNRPLRCEGMSEAEGKQVALPETDYVALGRWLTKIPARRRVSGAAGYSIMK